ncbi:MAG: N-acetylmuramoyl-L-alanine amidase [Paracoccaceae bacterium]
MKSPNHNARRLGPPDMVVIHYTGMKTAAAACARLCDPSSEVSAHWMIHLDGRAEALVDEARRAWHAGVASWGGKSDVNSRSIGIELVNCGHEHGYHPFPEPQMAALERLLHEIMARWPVLARNVVGHEHVAPGRKIDPGEKFDWDRLVRQGLATARN